MAILAAALAAGSWIYLRRSHQVSPDLRKPSPQEPAAPSPAAASGDVAPKIRTPKFDPLPAPVAPTFLSGVATTPDVKVSFYYEGDETTPTDGGFYMERTAVPDEQGKKYVLLPSEIDPHAGYGPTEHAIFKNEDSHAYQGIPISILNPQSKFSLQYVGLKIGDPRLIARLFVEMGIDYRSDDDGDPPAELPQPKASLPKGSFFPPADWFSPFVVYACGPGIYLRPVGRSLLAAATVENGVAWYKLEKPIALFNLPLDYCDKPAAASKDKKKKKSKEEEEDEAEQEMYCAPIDDFKGGALRLHILYQPNGIAGPLQIQAVNFIFQDQDGKYFQPTMGANFSTYYKALLVERTCLKTGRPADCVRPWQ